VSRKNKRTQHPPSNQHAGRKQPGAASVANSAPWWKRFSAGLVTLVCAPILVGVVAPVIISELPSSSNGQSSFNEPAGAPFLGTNLCARLRVDIQCTLSDIGSNSYMSREPITNLNDVPTCGTDMPGFLKWAKVHAIGTANSLVLNINSLGHAVVEIENLRVSLVQRKPPPRTLEIDCAGGGEGSSNYVYSIVHLDSNPPSVRYYCGENTCPVPNITVNPGGNAQFYIGAYSYRWLTEWAARIDLIVNGELMTINLGSYVTTPAPTGVRDCESTGGPRWVCASSIKAFESGS
jgi:hypothetical protein